MLEYCGVDFIDETPLSPSSIELISEHTLHYMGFDDLHVANEERDVSVVAGPSTRQIVHMPSLADIYSLMQQIQKNMNKRFDAFSLELQHLTKHQDTLEEFLKMNLCNNVNSGDSSPASS